MFEAFFDQNLTGFNFTFRWLHVFFGVIWIGHLYYFNFVHGAFMAEADAGAKSQVVQKHLPRALWWFRYGALGTFLTGLVLLMVKAHLEAKAGAFDINNAYWINILTGGLMATLMFLNVWLIIWPKQKVVIANAVATAAGQAANPAAAPAAARALVASRTNTLFSIPMLFFMLSASHLLYPVDEGSMVGAYWVAILVLIGGLQANAMYGKTGPMTTIKGVITSGFVLTAVILVLNNFLI